MSDRPPGPRQRPELWAFRTDVHCLLHTVAGTTPVARFGQLWGCFQCYVKANALLTDEHKEGWDNRVTRREG